MVSKNLSFVELDDVTKFKDAIETLGHDVLDEHLLKVYNHGYTSLVELNIDKDLAKKLLTCAFLLMHWILYLLLNRHLCPFLMLVKYTLS